MVGQVVCNWSESLRRFRRRYSELQHSAGGGAYEYGLVVLLVLSTQCSHLGESGTVHLSLSRCFGTVLTAGCGGVRPAVSVPPVASHPAGSAPGRHHVRAHQRPQVPLHCRRERESGGVRTTARIGATQALGSSGGAFFRVG